MTILRIYRKVGNHTTKFATGNGELLADKLDINITEISDSIVKGTQYLVGPTEADARKFSCVVGATKKGETAVFNAVQAGSEEAHSGALELVRQFQQAEDAVTKTVIIQIDPTDLNILKGADYRLCFAKKVGDNDFNVVWQSYTRYLINNSFSWTPRYDIFGSNLFQGNVEVRVSTNTVTIGLGETSTLNTAGVLGAASTGGPETGFTMVNDYGAIHPGVNQSSTGVDGKTVSTPIYVAVNEIVSGSVLLTPIEQVLVWFEQNIETSTMFSDARSRQIMIDMTESNTATRLYKDGSWTTP